MIFSCKIFSNKDFFLPNIQVTVSFTFKKNIFCLVCYQDDEAETLKKNKEVLFYKTKLEKNKILQPHS